MDNYQRRILKRIDNLTGYYDKLEYLNSEYLKANASQEIVILDMIEQLKHWGQ